MTIRYPNKHRLPSSAYEDRENAFHVVIRAVAGTASFVGATGNLIWSILVHELKRGSIVPLAMVLMPDHLHAVVRPGDRSVVRWVQGFKSYSTRRYAESGDSPFLWQPSFFDRVLRDDAEYLSAVRYVWRNPFEAGLVGEGGTWPWGVGQ